MRRLIGSRASSDQAAATGRRRVALLALFVGFVTACSSPPSETATGPELYSQLCSSCHGVGLEGEVGPPLGEGSPSATLPDSYLVTSIRRGIGTMPSFDHLSEGQVNRLIAFLRDVQAGT
ncbi:MAG: cytochrome c [Acidimicrobiia bacterium]|nr:cytochrome c [bacterium]MYA40143.1 cytochrome c [Acidimicrobiia bacterium]MYH06755.1 cytochrome c [Acidimicrobiia bacterium]MYK55286.1 cytochrome c [Acidimicrobiia bacterium]